MAGGGYDIGASLSGSASSGASLSGAIEQGTGGRYGTTNYGAGGVFTLDQTGSLGAGGFGGGTNWTPIIISVVLAVIGWIIYRRGR